MTDERKSIVVEPEWGGMFRYAIQMIKDVVPQDRGREFLILMMEFGERLYDGSLREQSVKEINERIKENMQEIAERNGISMHD